MAHVNLRDDLHQRAKALALAERTTLQAIVNEALETRLGSEPCGVTTAPAPTNAFAGGPHARCVDPDCYGGADQYTCPKFMAEYRERKAAKR